MPASKPVNTPGEIDLTEKALTTLPPAPAEHAALEVLWLDRNRLEMLPLTALPAWLAGFTRLEKLDVRRNRLDPVPR